MSLHEGVDLPALGLARAGSSSRRPGSCRGRERAGPSTTATVMLQRRASCERRRGDRVVARAQRRQHLQVALERQLAGRELLEQVEHATCAAPAPPPGSGPSSRRPGPGAAAGSTGTRCAAASSWICLRVADVLQLDVVAEQPRHADRLVHRQEASSGSRRARRRTDAAGSRPKRAATRWTARPRCAGPRRGGRPRGRPRRPAARARDDASSASEASGPSWCAARGSPRSASRARRATSTKGLASSPPAPSRP